MLQDNKPNWILFHCSAANSSFYDQFTMINQSHQARGFDLSSLGYYVGYQRLITGGKNYQARQDLEHGDHCNNPTPVYVDGNSMNFNSLGVCVGFDGDNEDVPAWAVPLLKEQIQTWMKEYNIPIERVQFHRDYNTAKTCPGSRITREWLVSLLGDATPTSVQDVVDELPQVANIVAHINNFPLAQRPDIIRQIQTILTSFLKLL